MGAFGGRCDRCRGWSGRLGRWRAAGGFEQVHPLGLAVPGFGQVQGDFAAAVAGGAGGDVDQVAAQRGAARLAVARLARDPAARSRLWLMAARASQAALAGNEPDGR